MTSVSGVNNDNEILCFDAVGAERGNEQPEANADIQYVSFTEFHTKSRCKCSGNL